jgi:UDP-N-acetylbacillosamine N-acetyltransferase
MQNKTKLPFLYILGCGGHAKSVADIVLSSHISESVIFVGEKAHPDEKILGYEIIHSEQMDSHIPVVLGLGDNKIRKEAFKKYTEMGRKVLTVIASTSQVSAFSRIGSGVVIAHGAFVGPDTIIGDGALINSHAVIEHECSVGAFSHIAPGTTISGRAKIGSECFLGVGSTVKEKITIHSGVQTGAGTVVVKDILKSGLYIGVPARPLHDS